MNGHRSVGPDNHTTTHRSLEIGVCPEPFACEKSSLVPDVLLRVAAVEVWVVRYCKLG